MDYTFVSFYQGTSGEDPSIVEIIVKYQDREICFHTYMDIDYTIVQDSDEYNAEIETVVQSVLQNCPAQIPNPTYDPSLTACWT